MAATFPHALTDVSTSWLEERRLAGEVPGRAPIVRADVERIGVGFGLDGIVARVTVFDAASETSTLILKWSKPESSAREGHALRSLGWRAPGATSRLIASFRDEEAALLVLEDLAGARQGDAIVGATPEEALRLVDRVVEIQVAYHATTSPGALDGFRAWGEDAKGQSERTAQRLPEFLAWWSHLLSPWMRRRVESLPDDVLAAHARLAQATPTLIHSDLHLDNVMFRADGEPVIIDWPDAARGPGVVDVVRILVEGVTIETRRRIEDEVWKHYRRTLGAVGIELDPKAMAEEAADALIVGTAGVVRFRPPDKNSPDRLVPIIENLVRNCSAAMEDAAGVSRS
ncbi:MAG: phosphotransferase family protein [Planctomycetota bacterium]